MTLAVTTIRVERTNAEEQLQAGLDEAGIEAIEEMTVIGDVGEKYTVIVVHPEGE